MSRVVLFDIDGTLIKSGGAGARALNRAMARVLGRDEVEADFSFAGMTDRAIFRRMLGALGLEASESHIERVLEVYPDILREEVANASGYRVLPGIVAALDAVADTGEVALGLGTGNVERGARIKLERVALNHYFSFGGFGCDAERRDELLRAGAARGAARLGRPLEECRVLVVGDTPLDVAAAHAIGARCLALATGGASAGALRAAGADHVFGDLAEPGALDVLLAS